MAFDITVYNTGPRLYLSYITARGYGILDPELTEITDKLAALAGTRAAPVNNRSYPGLVLDIRLTQTENRQALLGLLEAFLTLLKQAPKNV